MSELTEIKTILNDFSRCQKEQGEKLDSVHKALAGDEYGNLGLVKEQKIIKGIAYKNKARIDKAYWLSGIIATFVSTLAAMAGKFWDKS